MKFENKIITVLILILILSFSVINVTSVVYIRNIVEENLVREAYIYSKLLTYNRSEGYPAYMYLSEKPVLKKGYSIIAYTGRHYVLVRDGYIKGKLANYMVFVFLWEAGSVVMLLLLFYYTIYRYIKKERDSKDLLNLMLLALTHRLGNFLAVHRLNIEFLEDSAPKHRLKKSVDILESTYNSTIEAIEHLQAGQEESPEIIDLPQILLELTVLYGDAIKKDIRLQVNSSVRIKAKPTYVYMLVDTLVDNAIKHSKGKVYVRLLRYKGRNILLLRNDVGSGEVEGGTGMGLRIAKYICEKLNFDMRIRTKRNFTVAVCM